MSKYQMFEYGLIMSKMHSASFSTNSIPISKLLLLTSLMLCSFSCQTWGPSAAEKQNKASLIETKIQLIQHELDQGKPEVAIQMLKPLVDEEPDDPLSLNMMGLAYLALANHQKAQFYFEKAYKLSQDPAYALNLSSALISEGSYKKAREVLLEAQNLKYMYKERIYHNFALTFEKTKQFDKAEKYYKKAVVENPSYYLSFIRLGYIYRQTKKIPQAIQAYQKAHQFCQSCFEPVQELVYLKMESKDYQVARGLIEEFLKAKNIGNAERQEAKNLHSLVARLVQERTVK